MSPPFSTGLEPATRRPKYRPPAKACDCHAHVIGPFAKYPPSRPTAEATLEAYLKMHEVLAIDRGVLTQPSHYGIDNSCLLDALSRTGGTLRGIVALDAEALTEAEVAALHARGVRGVRISSIAKVGPKLSDIEAVADRIKDAGWHIEIMPPDAIEPLVELRPRLERLPVPVVFDQMGCPNVRRGVDDPSFQKFLALLRDGLAWVKLSHPYHLAEYPYTEVTPFARELAAANSGRCVFATDWPHPRAQNHKAVPDDAFLLDLFAEWFPDEALRRKILVDNAAAVYDF